MYLILAILLGIGSMEMAENNQANYPGTYQFLIYAPENMVWEKSGKYYLITESKYFNSEGAAWDWILKAAPDAVQTSLWTYNGEREKSIKIGPPPYGNAA